MLLLNDAVVNYLSVSKEFIEETAREQMVEVERRQKLYRGDRAMAKIAGRTVIVVDDGLATGATMKVAVRALKRKEPSKLVIAVPLGAASTCSELKNEADELICLMTPEPFFAVGSWYENFEQTTDQQVRELLQKAHDLHLGNQSS
jgi:predicted phosphoribosyltransferase